MQSFSPFKDGEVVGGPADKFGNLGIVTWCQPFSCFLDLGNRGGYEAEKEVQRRGEWRPEHPRHSNPELFFSLFLCGSWSWSLLENLGPSNEQQRYAGKVANSYCLYLPPPTGDQHMLGHHEWEVMGEWEVMDEFING